MRYSAPAAQGGQQRLNLNLGGTDNSTTPKKPKEISHIRILKEIGVKWVDRRCYRTLDRALRALITGEI